MMGTMLSSAVTDTDVAGPTATSTSGEPERSIFENEPTDRDSVFETPEPWMALGLQLLIVISPRHKTGMQTIFILIGHTPEWKCFKNSRKIAMVKPVIQRRDAI